jgi:nitrogen fixation/metabolism regulation signal transduction histidine kinase
MQTGATASLDHDLISSAQQYMADTGDISAKLTLTYSIEELIRQNQSELVNVALVTPDAEILLQKNRAIYNLYSENDLWNASNQEHLEKLCVMLREQLDKDTVPRAAVSTEPNSFTLSSNNARISTKRNLLHIAYALPGNQRDAKNLECILVFTFFLTSVDDFFNKTSEMNHDYTSACITDSSQKVLYAQDENYLNQDLAQVRTARTKLLSRKIEESDWTLYLLLDLDAMKASVSVQYMRGILIFMLAILLICALQLILTNRELRPIRSIGKAMKLVKQGVWKTRIEIKGNDEIWTLARNYNDMADALEEWRELNRRQNEEKLQYIYGMGGLF